LVLCSDMAARTVDTVDRDSDYEEQLAMEQTVHLEMPGCDALESHTYSRQPECEFGLGKEIVNLTG